MILTRPMSILPHPLQVPGKRVRSTASITTTPYFLTMTDVYTLSMEIRKSTSENSREYPTGRTLPMKERG